MQHVFGTTEGTFQIDHPVLAVEWPQPGGKDLGLGTPVYWLAMPRTLRWIFSPRRRYPLFRKPWEMPPYI
jgi:hypothetical protein